ncbi:hypothetical protein [Amycolatopsis alkalitolerans]|uniref:Uncharacterized protein n=1 Tax=Amycolatopsis alkalitolerans TaxID=2547244 RepID=A0A5C4LZY0_9PSEU|nr:hypothetical protein [Amycolatopsis alkalitolerans]TNC25710.1 hypothetical protein FG385_13740 [Amycolatopsis alkalitolerans]
MNDQGMRRPGLSLPMQAAPVDRAGTAGGKGTNGVEADFGLGDLLNIGAGVAESVLPGSGGIVKGLGGLLGGIF